MSTRLTVTIDMLTLGPGESLRIFIPHPAQEVRVLVGVDGQVRLLTDLGPEPLGYVQVKVLPEPETPQIDLARAKRRIEMLEQENATLRLTQRGDGCGP